MAFENNYKFSITLTNDNYIVRDHRLHGSRIMPGVTFLDILYRFLMQKGFQPKEIELKNILFKEPLVTTAEFDKKVQFVLNKKEDYWDIQASSQKVKGDQPISAEWSENLSAELHNSTNVEPNRIDLESLKQTALKSYDMDRAYSYARKEGIMHYEFMKGLGTIYEGDEYLLAEIKLSDFAMQFIENYYLHPAYLDSATLVPSALVFKYADEQHLNASEIKPFIPIYIEEFRSFSSIKEKCYIYVKDENTTVSQEQDIAYATMEVYDEHGRQLALYHKFGLKKVRSENLIKKLENKGDEKQSLPSPTPDVTGGVISNHMDIKGAIKSYLCHKIANLTGGEAKKLDLGTSFYDQGLESRNLLQLVQEIEEEIGIKLYPTLLFEYATIEKLSVYFAVTYEENFSNYFGITEVTQDGMVMELRQMVAEIVGKSIEEISVEESFYDQGLDSRNLLQLVQNLESKYGKKLYPTLLFEYPNIGSLAQYFQEELSNLNMPAASIAMNASTYEEPKEDTNAKSAEDDDTEFYYKAKWVPEELTIKENDSTQAKEEKVLILYADQAAELKRSLSRKYAKDMVYHIKLSNSNNKVNKYNYHVDVNDVEIMNDYVSRIKEVDIVYFLGGFQNEEIGIENTDAWEQCQNRGVVSLFRLLKAMSGAKLLQKLKRLIVITNNSFQVLHDDVILPYSGTLTGFIKSASKEYPFIKMSCIDAERGDYADRTKEEIKNRLIDIILKEPQQIKGEQIAVRNGIRYKRMIERANLVEPQQSTFRQNGVYFIVGGAGGIGLELSRHLIQTYNAKIILIGRSELNQEKQKAIEKIDSSKTSITYISADITNSDKMKDVLSDVKNKFGNINGVVHSALVLKDKMIEMMDEKTLLEVLEPKVKGSVVLYQTFCKEPLDFLLFFSSSQSFIGDFGQSNYAAANTFEDSFSAYLSQKSEIPMKSINWGYWGSVGVASSKEYNQELAKAGAKSIEPEEGMETIERFLSSDLNQVLAAKVENYILEAFGIRGKQEQKQVASVDKTIEILDIAKADPDENFLNYWKNLKEGNKKPIGTIDLERDYIGQMQEYEARMLHLMVKTENSSKMEVILSGRGETILFINGFAMTAPQWYYQFKDLSKEYRLIDIHMPGFGLSEDNEDMSFHGIAKTFLEVLDALHIESPIHVVGSSWGGMLAQTIASEYPQMVKSLTLISSFARFTDHTAEETLRDKLIVDFNKKDRSEYYDIMKNSEFANPVLDKYSEILTDQGFSTVDMLTKVRAPTLIVVGGEDVVMPTDESRYLHNMIKSSQFYEIVDAGHVPNLTHHNVFNKRLVEFITGIEHE